MKPKSAIPPRLLAAGHDNLFMAPCGGGCALIQWAEARTRLVVSPGREERQRTMASHNLPLPVPSSFSTLSMRFILSLQITPLDQLS